MVKRKILYFYVLLVTPLPYPSYGEIITDRAG